MVRGGGRGRGRRRLAGWWINGGEIRVRVLGCQGGVTPARLEGAWGAVVRLWGGRGTALAMGRARGGGLSEMGEEEAGGTEKNPNWRRRHRNTWRARARDKSRPRVSIQQSIQMQYIVTDESIL
jgi:hypothetical protein